MHIYTLYTTDEIYIFLHNNSFALMEIKSSNLSQCRSQLVGFSGSVGELCKAFTSFLAVVYNSIIKSRIFYIPKYKMYL